MADTPDTPRPNPDAARAQVHALVDCLDEAAVLVLLRFLHAWFGVRPWGWWREGEGEPPASRPWDG